MPTEPPDDIHRAFRQRISSLGAAILRINASLDLATVLQEAIDNARVLIGARYGIITTIDEASEVREFVTSGLTDEEHRQLTQWSDGPRLFAHLRSLPGAVRLADLPAYVRSLGYPFELLRYRTFLGIPMRYRGVQIGNFFLAEKEGAAEFSAEDEELLVLFAAQAAAAIANARTYRNEQRARADLEALVETSPVGVVVFDVATGRPLSFNREARRIVERLRSPERAPEESLDVLTCRFADGREVALAQIPLAHALGSATTLRAEEITLSLPDGRSVRTLINATPIRSEDGAVVSVVVTMQDLAALEELERLRAQFLGMVSHELRSPLTSIKGSAAAVLSGPALPRAEMLQFFRIIDTQADHMQSLIGNLLDAGRIEAGTLSVDPEPTEVAALVDRARNTFLSGGARHVVDLDLPPGLPRVMADLERVVQVLNNLLSNAARHAPESSPIRVQAERDGVHIAISVSDQGRGVPPQMLGQLFRKHVALADGKAEGGATGLGLAICKGLVEAHGGRIRAESAGLGHGARFTFTLPAVEGEHGGARGRPAARASARPRARAPGAPLGRPRILVVDDDPHTLRLVRDALSRAGYAVLVTAAADELGDLIRSEQPRLVLLDLVLPGVDGIELMAQIPELADVPVIFISGYGRDETIARAFESGAADYIVKPFSPTELAARVGAVLRRRAGSQPFVLGELTVDYERRRVTVGGRAVALTVTEYELLRILSVNSGRVVSVEALLRQVWGNSSSSDTEPVRSFVMKLRAKLGDDATHPTYIFNQRGIGYRMPEPSGD